jgi:putative thioredoxin
MSYDVSDFRSQVLERSDETPVLVDFWAQWCVPCRALSPILERLEAKAGDAWVLAKVDIDRHQEAATSYGISSIPNVKLFHGGKVIGEFVGALPEFEIKQWLKKYLPDRNGAKLESVTLLLHEGKRTEAERMLQNILREDPGNQRAKAMLAVCLIFTDPSEALRLIENIDDPKTLETVEAIKTLARLIGLAADASSLPASAMREEYLQAADELRGEQFDQALEHFIRVIREDRYFDDDGARKACIAIFRILGEDHPTTQQFRRAFSGALYV